MRWAWSLVALAAACGGASTTDLISGSDGGAVEDAGDGFDSGADAGASDGGADATTPKDASTTDGAKDSGADGSQDSGLDAGAFDSGCGDLTASNANCGACGYGCVHNRTCVASRCSPAWQTITTVNEPTPRTGHAAAALSGKVYFFGGGGAADAGALDTGGAYDPAADGWSAMPSLKKARCNHAAAASTARIYTYGGVTSCGDPTTTGPTLEEFDGATWSEDLRVPAPTPREIFPGVWTGSSFFVFGGTTAAQAAIAAGARYMPDAGLDGGWLDNGCGLASCVRGGFFGGFLDGTSVRYFGGSGGNAPAGLAYDLVGNAWAAWATPPSTPLVAHRTADQGRLFLALEATAVTCPHGVAVRIYDKTTATWTKDTASSPAGLNADAATAWLGSELFAWSGDCGAGASVVGARYQPPAPTP